MRFFRWIARLFKSTHSEPNISPEEIDQVNTTEEQSPVVTDPPVTVSRDISDEIEACYEVYRQITCIRRGCISSREPDSELCAEHLASHQAVGAVFDREFSNTVAELMAEDEAAAA